MEKERASCWTDACSSLPSFQYSFSRTGAGKSSLLTALLRLTELDSGSVNIDGVDVSTIGLRQLRNSIAILPQDPLLFSGTLRTNLDPFSEYDDARLWDALRRAYLVDGPFSNQKSSEEKPEVAENSNKVNSRLNLDSVIEEEGGNLSLGQRSLVSLARALVKDSRIVSVIVVDESSCYYLQFPNLHLTDLSPRLLSLFRSFSTKPQLP